MHHAKTDLDADVGNTDVAVAADKMGQLLHKTPLAVHKYRILLDVAVHKYKTNVVADKTVVAADVLTDAAQDVVAAAVETAAANSRP